MELTADIVFNSVFPEQEMEKEVDVILDEIQSYNDSPSELIYDDFEELVFANSALGRNILGKPEMLKNYKREDILRFIANNYHTDEMVFFSLGNLDFKKLVRWAEKYFGQYTANLRQTQRKAPELYVPQQVKAGKDTHQIHLMLGNRAYSLDHPDRLGLYLLNNILGGPGMNSLLNLALREKHGLAYNIESSCTSYTDTGLFSIYLGCDPKNKDKSVKLIYNELKQLRENPMLETRVEKYKKQLMGQLAISSQNKENLALSIGKSFLRFNRIESTEEIQKRLEAIDAAKLQAIANEVFDEKMMTSLLFY
jgi:predicted Zn-dependent peptidase